jgi:hypothetical protein
LRNFTSLSASPALKNRFIDVRAFLSHELKAAKLRAMRKQELTIKIIIIISNSNNNNDNNNKNNNTNNLKIDKEHTQTYILQFWP